MKLASRFAYLSAIGLFTAVFAVVGCNQGETKKAAAETAKKTAKDNDGDHGWWCAEHGIPEEMCGLCNKTYRDKQKAEGDWCEAHKRLKSQCFKCDPSLYERVFEPMYVAKYGKKPERPPVEEFTK